ncbi:MAG: hypothetical protein MRY21_01100 [Simkaniaceae bacterium]|nr:hypothetical protein [Simkaniaceae bacterium]
MIKKLIFLLLFCSLQAANFRGIHELYQDVMVNNHFMRKGVRECHKRYEILRDVFDLYDRPFTILDIGAAQGYFCFRAAHDYDATCVMIENGYSPGDRSGDLLVELCEENDQLGRLVVLKTTINTEKLRRLGECEHFDVVLALDILPHLRGDFKENVQAILSLGDNVLIETSTDIEYHMGDYVGSLGGELLGVASRHSSVEGLGEIYWFEQNRTNLKKRHWYAKASNRYTIESDFFEKFLIKDDVFDIDKLFEWIPGINLMTFKALNGAYPNLDFLNKKLLELKWDEVNDPMPWEIIIGGDRVALIRDKEHPPVWSHRDAKRFCYRILKADSRRLDKLMQSMRKYVRPY